MTMEDDLPVRGTKDPVHLLCTQDLDPLSLAELDARIAALEAELERTRQKRAHAGDFRARADSLFAKR